MKRASFGLVIAALLFVAVACQTILPDTPIFQRITTPTHSGRGVDGEVGIMVDPTPTPTVKPGFFLFLNPPALTTCRELIETSYPTAAPVWTRDTSDIPLGDIEDELLICNTVNGAQFNLLPIGYSRGHSFGGDWELRCKTSPEDCALSVPVPWTPDTTSVLDCGLAGGTWQVAEETVAVEIGPYVVAGDEEMNTTYLFMVSGSVGPFFGCNETISYHGYEITGVSLIVGDSECSSETSPICIVEVNAMQDATPTTSAMKDYNLRGLQGANDEYVEVVCFDPMTAAGWSLSDGTSSYVYASDNFCWPLKTIYCDEMTGCDLETGFPDTGIWSLYDPDGNLRDLRLYPVMATPGNSWAAASYLAPEGGWVEIKPHPGTFPTNTVTPTPTYTPTATPAP